MKRILLVLACIFCLGVTRVAFAAEEYNVQSFWAPAHQLSKGVWEPWCKELTEKSGGKAIFHYYGLNMLVKTDAVPGAVRDGVLDIGGIQLQTAASMMPLSQLLSMPYLVQNADEACQLARTFYATFPEARQEVEKNFKLLMAVSSDRFCFVATGGLIKTPADLKGKRVLIWAGNMAEEVKSWGGIPVQISSSETYMGLQRGLGEVAYVPAPGVDSGKLYEVGKYITIIPSRSLPMIIAINWDTYKNMPADVQKLVVDTSGDKMSDEIGKKLVQITSSDMERFTKTAGCTVHYLTSPVQKPFKDAADQVNRDYWLDFLKRNNVKDPAGWMKKVEDLAAATFKR